MTSSIMATATRTVAALPFNLAPVWRESPTPKGEIDPSCTPFTLPSLGLLNQSTTTITLQADATFTPLCTIDGKNGYVTDLDATSGPAHLRDPFYASTIPMTYSVAATTTVAYILFLLLLVSPPGSRPWLQKIATLTVAISLTIAWGEMNQEIQHQYSRGYLSAQKLRLSVVGGLVIRISRVVSDTFLWLAQVQTLIRLFPRHREKIVIKWAGFVLIILDTVFSVVNNFLSPFAPDKSFLDAVPALSYLFQLALSFLYASCVLYYAFKHRYFSFMPPLSMGNQRRHASSHSNVAMPVVALVSMASILLPIVFFILDISNREVAGWGDFVRWVGAAAASVVVWEWVDRIERLEDLGRKRGVLGREIFDGDEMLEGVGGTIVEWRDGTGGPDSSDHPNNGGYSTRSFPLGPIIRPQRSQNLEYSEKQPRFPPPRHAHTTEIMMPPLSRANTGSTTYAVRVHPTSNTPPAQPTGGRVSRGSSHLHETTISDFAISPAWTPSVEGHQMNNSRRPMELDEGERESENRHVADIESNSDHNTEQRINLPYVHRTGQAPFNPEMFSQDTPKGWSYHSPMNRLRSIGSFFKSKKSTSDISTDTQAIALPTSSGGESSGQGLSPPNSGSASMSPDIYQVGSNQTVSPLNPMSDVTSHSTAARSAVSNVSGIFRGRGGIGSGSKKTSKLPVTVIPALRKGEVVDLKNLERARERERQRQMAGIAPEHGDAEGNLGGAERYVTHFQNTPFQDAAEEAALRNRSVSPSENSRNNSRPRLQLSSSPARTNSQPSTTSRRTPMSPGFADSGHTGDLGPPASPQNLLASQTNSFRPPPPSSLPQAMTVGSQRTPPLPTRSSTASPNSSARSSSTVSWNHRTSPGPAVSSNSPASGMASLQQQRHSPASVEPTEAAVTAHGQRMSSQILGGAGGTVLDPAVIVEEAESYSSFENGRETGHHTRSVV